LQSPRAPYSAETRLYGEKNAAEKLGGILCCHLMTEETYNHVTKGRSFFPQIELRYRISTQDRRGYFTLEIVIDVSSDFNFLIPELIAPVGIGIVEELAVPVSIEVVGNEINGMIVVASPGGENALVRTPKGLETVIYYKIDEESIEWIEKSREDGFDTDLEGEDEKGDENGDEELNQEVDNSNNMS
jgi:hypothetical protein